MSDMSSSSRRAGCGGQIFGNYSFSHILAEGAMGVIFEATHTVIQRTVALKIVNPKYAAREGYSRQLIDQFLHEARVMGAIDHPNVVTLYDAGVVGQCPYLAMRLVSDGDLESRVQRFGPLSDEDGLRLLHDTASGVAAVHAAGYINRDIKPGNILLESDGTPRLSDFGVAILTRDVTPGAIIAGTPAYLAPEMAHGRAFDERSDIYSLGATFWHALMGKPPFTGDSVQEILSHVLSASEAPEPVLAATPRGRALTQILRHAMQFDPAKRYRTADEVVHDCASVIDGGEADYAMIGRKRKKTFIGALFDR